MKIARSLVSAGALGAGLLLLSAPTHAFELTTLDETPLRLDITATTLSSYHSFEKHLQDYEFGYGDLYNRINLQLSYGSWVGAARLDTSTFLSRPDAMTLATDAVNHGADPNDLRDIYQQKLNALRSRYRDNYTVGKAYLSYANPNFEVTAGDSYVQFGRGIALSMRKQDDVGIDTTLLGGKVVARNDLAKISLVGGVANPVMVDIATGQSLYQLDPLQSDIANGRQGSPLFARDTILGARGEVFAWEGATLGLHTVRFIRGPDAEIDSLKQFMRDTFGSTISGLSAEMPLPSSIGTFYIEGDLQQNSLNPGPNVPTPRRGIALYASADVGLGPINAVVELQHNRDYDALPATVNLTRADAFIPLRYAVAPNTEPVGIDYRFGAFDRCVTGGRAKFDGRTSKNLTLWTSIGYWATWGERSDECLDDTDGPLRNNVIDASGGFELQLENGASHVFGSTGVRHDQALGNPGNPKDPTDHRAYDEWFIKTQMTKHISGPWSGELEFRERRRIEQPIAIAYQAFNQGELFVSLRYAPAIIGTLGLQYTGEPVRAGKYFNVSGTWKYSDQSSIKLFVGGSPGGLLCINNVCRLFPPFSGAKLEWVQRY